MTVKEKVESEKAAKEEEPPVLPFPTSGNAPDFFPLSTLPVVG